MWPRTRLEITGIGRRSTATLHAESGRRRNVLAAWVDEAVRPLLRHSPVSSIGELSCQVDVLATRAGRRVQSATRRDDAATTRLSIGARQLKTLSTRRFLSAPSRTRTDTLRIRTAHGCLCRRWL